MRKPEHFEQKMDLEETRHWLECLEADLLDVDYCVRSDSETHFKLAALRRVWQRNIEVLTAYENPTKSKEIG